MCETQIVPCHDMNCTIYQEVHVHRMSSSIINHVKPEKPQRPSILAHQSEWNEYHRQMSEHT